MATSSTSSDTPKRRVACETCHILKARCEASIDGPNNACERCWRSGKTCIPIKRRRPRDRIAELEAQIAMLTHLLQVQGGLQDGNTRARREDSGAPDKSDMDSISPRVRMRSRSCSETGPLEMLDALVSLDHQQEALDMYQKRQSLVFPMITLESTSVLQMRANHPLLLFSIVAFASASLFPDDVQAKLIQDIMQLFARDLLGVGKHTIDLTRALLVASFWFRSRPDFKHGSVHQLIQESVLLATDKGLAGPQSVKSPGARFEHGPQQTSLPARRIWLACFVATASYSVVMRRREANVWTAYHSECIEYLMTEPSSSNDTPLCLCAEGENICFRIANDLGLCEPSATTEFTDDSFRHTRAELKQDIDIWAASIPHRDDSKAIKMYAHVARAYLNEPVLYTPKNRMTFSVPFADQLAATEFAAPDVTEEHKIALYDLRDACHSILDIALGMDPNEILALSSLSHIPRILYAVFVLVKMYIALTGPENTFGAVMSPCSLRLEPLFQRLEPLADSLKSLDPGSYNPRIINAYRYLETWFHQYNALTKQYEAAKAQEIVQASLQACYDQWMWGVDDLRIGPE